MYHLHVRCTTGTVTDGASLDLRGNQRAIGRFGRIKIRTILQHVFCIERINMASGAD